MKRIALFSCLFVLSAPIPAFAGFEWAPPANNPAPRPQPTNAPMQQAPMAMPAPVAPPMMAPPQVAPPMPPTQMGGYPSAPVVSEPLQMGRPIQQPITKPMPLSPPPSPVMMQSPQMPVPQMRNISRSGLVIDPYPLRNDKTGQAENLTEGSVQQAMIEEAQILRPLQLGAGMTTGAQAVRSQQPSAYDKRVQPSMPRGPFTSTPSALTPMQGGEPAPLPSTTSIIEAYKQAAIPVNRNYAEAVGFGRDLPLGLALSQVIPSEFSHSFADDVDAGTTVTWEGGKPWNQVLNDMLRPKNMIAEIHGNTVFIKTIARS